MDLEIREIKFNAGATVVVRNSENPGYFFIVRSGMLEVDSEHRFKDKALSRFEAGDSFGLVSALTARRFLVTVYAKEPSVVLRIPVLMLGAFLKKQKSTAFKMLSLYSGELRALHHHLASANLRDERENHPRRLLLNARYYLEWSKEKLASYALRKYIDWIEAGNPGNQLEQAKQLLSTISEDYSGPRWSENALELPAEEVIFLENEISSEIYVVESGAVRLFKIVRGMEFVIDVLGPGELFGEMSVIDKAPRMASAVTALPSKILRLTPETLFEQVGEKILQRMFTGLARRIWFSHQRLIVLRIREPVTRIYAFLYNLVQDSMIKKGQNPDAHIHDSFEFQMSFEEMKTMCGIIRAGGEILRPLLEDANIIFDRDRTIIQDRKRLEEKVQYRTKIGQIDSSLI